MQTASSSCRRQQNPPCRFRWLATLSLSLLLACASGCGSTKAKKQNQPFFTSGSRDADQRASQRMAKAEEMAGSGEGAGETDTKKAKSSGSSVPGAAQVPGKASLYDRLGGDKGLSAIIDDFMPRALQDPRVNWARKGNARKSLFHPHPKDIWTATPDHVNGLKKHLVEFLALATGGPAHYEGREIKPVHADMQISNPEFDATIGDLKASLDKLKIANQEQKELLAIVESTRPEIVTQR